VERYLACEAVVSRGDEQCNTFLLPALYHPPIAAKTEEIWGLKNRSWTAFDLVVRIQSVDDERRGQTIPPCSPPASQAKAALHDVAALPPHLTKPFNLACCSNMIVFPSWISPVSIICRAWSRPSSTSSISSPWSITPPPVLFRCAGVYGARKKMYLLGDRTRAHISCEKLGDRSEVITGFFFGFSPDRAFRIVFLQKSGTSFD